MTALVGMLGGPETFVRRLQFFHDSGLAYMGNEPNFLPVYQYHYAGRPDLSTKQIHAYIPRLFYNALGGIPGNDDSGAMGSFVALSMMGLFPVAGQDVYLISAPFFKELRITNALTKKEGVVRSVGFDPTYAERVYIKGVKRDGVPWTKNWIGHDFFTEGGVLEITLGTEEEVGTWGTREEDLPPSIPLW
jgi:putative alpha-1,2-mannosidase